MKGYGEEFSVLYRKKSQPFKMYFSWGNIEFIHK